jgi:outer membrane protein assembly factor BamB
MLKLDGFGLTRFFACRLLRANSLPGFAGFVLVTSFLSLGMVARQSARANEPGSGDWVMFGGTPERNFVNLQETNIPETWDVDSNENIRWSVDLGSKAYGGPIVAGGRVFIGTNNQNPRDPSIQGDKGVLMCFDESSGDFLWQLVFDKLPAGRVQDWPEEGICSSPIVEGNRLYFVSNRCTVVCADVAGDADKPGQGKIIWQYDMIGRDLVFPHNLAVCSPLIVGDLMFIVTANGVDEEHINIPSPEAPSFLCLNKQDGSFVWKNNAPTQSLVEARKSGGEVDIVGLVNRGLLAMHGQWSNPAYTEANGQPMVIFPGGDGWIYAFQPENGELLWKFDCNPKDSFYVLGPRATRNDFIGTPVVHDNRLYIGVGQDPEHKEGVGHLWCIDITTVPDNPDKDISPASKQVGDSFETIFDPQAPENARSGLVWHYGGPSPWGEDRIYRFGRSMSTCAVADGLVYTADLNGYVYCFDALTGERYWEFETNASIWGSPYMVDGKVFIGTDDGIMYVFQHTKDEHEPEEIEMGGKVRATAVAANGTLYVLTESKTKLFAIAAE